jgi:hypothetical protein
MIFWIVLLINNQIIIIIDFLDLSIILLFYLKRLGTVLRLYPQVKGLLTWVQPVDMVPISRDWGTKFYPQNYWTDFSEILYWRSTSSFIFGSRQWNIIHELY